MWFAVHPINPNVTNHVADDAPLPRLALLCDFAEEEWPSMNLVGEMLAKGLAGDASIRATKIVPKYRRLLGVLPRVGWNADRLLNRLRVYPKFARQTLRDQYDLFHVVDHSYSQLVHSLPPHRVGVFCHDLDTFRCLLDPAAEPRPRLFRAMMRHVLAGFQKAAIVFHSTEAVRQQIERHGLVDPSRLVQAPYGVSEEFTPDNGEVDRGRSIEEPFLLHVGSCIARKRIDVLLETFAAVRARQTKLRLVQIGGEWTAAQREQVERLGLESSITQKRGLTRTDIASLYRTAAVVLQPSESEGFGLPVAEALACGAVVIASDIPVLREVGGPAVMYCAVGDVAAWAALVERVLDDAAVAPPRDARLSRASRYSWATHIRTVADAYLRLWRGHRVS
jgi:glycosyltransferase involved in cell wall biosynthesis